MHGNDRRVMFAGRVWSPIMTPAKAIAMRNEADRNLKVLAIGLFSSSVVISLVSLLIGGVVRPLLSEW